MQGDGWNKADRGGTVAKNTRGNNWCYEKAFTLGELLTELRLELWSKLDLG